MDLLYIYIYLFIYIYSIVIIQIFGAVCVYSYYRYGRYRTSNGTLIFNIACYLWRCWLRRCATSRKVAGSIPDGAVGIFY
jgi:hypothetical protein